MAMNESKGNMYEFITHTWNPLKGKCAHDCSYCYMKKYPQKELRLVDSELNTNLGEDNFIFVGSSTDIFEESVNFDDISKIISKCNDNPNNKYFFQSKNPKRMVQIICALFDGECILATTIETNRVYDEMGKTPSPFVRAGNMRRAKMRGFKTAVTIEPIMDFDLDYFTKILEYADANYVNIGADSHGHNLEEPEFSKVMELTEEIQKFSTIHNKNNLDRLKNAQK